MMDGQAFNEGYAAAQSRTCLKPPYLSSVVFMVFGSSLFASCAKTDCMPVTTGNKKAGLFPAALYCRDLFPFLQCILQFHQPCRAVISHGEKLAILVAGNLNKSVFVVKEGRFIAVFQDASQRLKTLLEPP